MRGGEVVRRARRRAGLSRADLADRLGATRETVLEWENGDPPFGLVEGAVAACGLDLVAVLAEPEPDPHDLSLLDTTLALSVDERLARLVEHVRFVLAGREAIRESR